MRLLAGAVLVVASAICAAGNEIAWAEDKNAGGPLPFLAWAFGLLGAGLMAYTWIDEERRAKKP